MVILVAVLLIVIFGMVAFAVDTGSISATKSKMRAAADASALAAAAEMLTTTDVAQIQQEALDYANINVPDDYGNVLDADNVTVGIWDPETSTFTPDTLAPNAVRVLLQRTEARGNAVPYLFGRVFGVQQTDMTVEAIAVGAVPNTGVTTETTLSVYVTSTKDLSNVVLKFNDGTVQKFDDLSGYTGTFEGTGEHAGKEIIGVWIKSGCNSSDEGPGYGELLFNPGDGSTVQGTPGQGCKPKVTATFEATGATFTESGSDGPVRLVK
jgi:Flp pilus assembly protein TadG